MARDANNQRDQLFARFLSSSSLPHNSRKIDLLQAIFEPLKIEERLKLEYSFAESFKNSPEPQWNQIREKIFYHKCRALKWDIPTRNAIVNFYRSLLSLNSVDNETLAQNNTMEQMLDDLFQNLVHIMASTLERLIIDGLRLLPVSTSLPTQPLYWLQSMRSLRTLVIKVCGDRVDVRANIPFLQLQFTPKRYLAACQSRIRRTLVVASQINYKAPQYVNLPEHLDSEYTQYFAPYVEDIGPFPRWNGFTVEAIQQKIQWKIPYRRLTQYTVLLTDFLWIQNRRTGPELLAQIWRTCCDRLAPPPQIRSLHLSCVGTLSNIGWLKTLVAELCRFNRLERLSLVLSFKCYTFHKEDEYNRMMEQLDDVLKQTIKEYCGDDQDPTATTTPTTTTTKHRWSYRMLMLMFPDADRHKSLDPYSLHEQIGEQHLREVYECYRLFTGTNAPMLRELYLYVSPQVCSLVIEAPSLEKLYINYQYLQNFPPLYEPLFDEKKSGPLRSVRLLYLEDFSTKITTIVDDDNDQRSTRSYYDQLFAHMQAKFPSLTRIHLCCNAEKSSKSSAINGEYDGDVQDDPFYFKYHQVVHKFIHHYHTELTEMVFFDEQPKPYKLVEHILRQFIDQATCNQMKQYRLSIKQCDVRWWPSSASVSSSRSDANNNQQQQQSVDAVEFERQQQQYRQLLDTANKCRNLRLIIPTKIVSISSVNHQ